MPKGGSGKPGGIAFVILGLDAPSDTGNSDSDDLTRLSTNFTLTGTIDPSVGSFTLLINGASFTVTNIDAEGNWSFTYSGAALTDGTVLVEASYTTVHPKSGKEQTTTAAPYSFDLDSTAPSAPAGLTAAGSIISGTAEAGATIDVYDDGVYLGSTMADGTGAWSYDVGGATGSFTAVAIDAAGNASAASSPVEVAGAVNDPPDAVADGVATNEDTAVTINVLANDTDPNGDALSVTSVSAAANGSVTLNPDGTITYTPAANWSGTDSFTYTISDGNGGSDNATVTVTVNPVNDAPNAVTDGAVTNEDTAVTIAVLGNDSDTEGDPLTITSATNGANGMVTINPDGTLTYTPNGNFSGVDSFTYTISDGNGGTDTATVNVTVNPVNDAPDAAADGVATNEDTAVTINVLANDTDPDGDTLSVASISAAANGSVALNPDGTITYTPAANWSGTDSFTYTISDGNGGSDAATVTVTVNPVNDAPVAGNDSATTDEDTAATIAVLANDSDIEGDSLTVSIASQGANGTASVNPDGTVTYTPDADWSGTDSFTYTISDGNGGTDTATVTVTVNPVNDVPVAADDSATTDRDTAVTLAVLANDTDPEGDALSVTGATNGANGSVVVNPDGTVTYTPNAGFTGLDSFTYTVSDGNGGTDSATVTVTVNDPPPPPPPPGGDSFTPTDPLYAEQWHLAMLGDLERIWAEYTGSGVVVGIYDDGIEYDHVDLDGNYVAAAGFGLPDPYPTADAEAKHGTAVAGVIAAEANGIGTVGVAFDATISGVNIFSGVANINAADKTGFYAASDQQYRFDIVNHSWGSAPVFLNDVSDPTPQILDDWNFALQNGRGGLGTIILKAAGNSADNAQGDFLNAVRASITVAAYDWENDASWYTNRGANVLISAPSSGKTVYDAATGNLLPSSDLRIATTDRQGAFGYADDGDWSSSTNVSGFGGTSSATPTVSGVVALMLEANPDLGWRDVQNVLAYSAHHIGGAIGSPYAATETVPEAWLVPGGSTSTNVTVPVEYFEWFWNGADNWNGGGLHFSEDYGFGSVDAYNAVRMAEVWSLFYPAQTSANEAAAATASMSPNLSVSGNGSINSFQFNYAGPAMELEYVDITIRLNTELMQEVALEITSPEGTTVTLLDLPINDYTPAFDFLGVFLLRVNVDWTFGAHAFKGEDPNGVWTVTLTEKDVTFDIDNYGMEADGNTLSLLELDFYGRTQGQFGASLADDVYHYTSEMLSLGLDADPSRVSLDDTAGTDWFDFAATDGTIVSDLAPGGATTLNGVTIVQTTLATVIENAVSGDGDDTLLGNDVANAIYGMRGNDTLDGGLGDDTLAGGLDNDILWGDLGNDLFLFHDGDGADWIGDFTAGGTDDMIALCGTGFFDFATLAAAFSDIGGSAVIDLGDGDMITLAGLSSADLTAADFQFFA